MRIKYSLTALLILLFLSGCELYGKIGGADTNIQGSLPALLRGEWIYIQPGLSTPAERYVIEEDIIQYGFGGGKSEYDYKGDIRFVSNYSANSGVIIIEYIDTQRPNYAGYNGNSFFGIYYRNLSKNTVQLANAIRLTDMSSPDTATLDEAIGKFTLSNRGTLVNWSNAQYQSRVN